MTQRRFWPHHWGWSLCAGIALGISISLIVSGTVEAAKPKLGQRDSGANRQLFRWTADQARTTSKEFQEIFDLSDVSFVGSGSVVTTFSGVFEGGPIELKVVDNETGRILRPGVARFDASDGTRFFSFTFAVGGSRSDQCHFLDSLWRSPTGGQVSVKRGLLTVSYFRAPPGRDPGGTRLGPCVT